MIQSLGWNVHSINQNGNQFVVKIQDPESGRIIERFGPSEEWALTKAHQFAERQQHPHLSADYETDEYAKRPRGSVARAAKRVSAIPGVAASVSEENGRPVIYSGDNASAIAHALPEHDVRRRYIHCSAAINDGAQDVSDHPAVDMFIDNNAIHNKFTPNEWAHTAQLVRQSGVPIHDMRSAIGVYDGDVTGTTHVRLPGHAVIPLHNHLRDNLSGYHCAAVASPQNGTNGLDAAGYQSPHERTASWHVLRYANSIHMAAWGDDPFATNDVWKSIFGQRVPFLIDPERKFVFGGPDDLEHHHIINKVGPEAAKWGQGVVNYISGKPVVQTKGDVTLGAGKQLQDIQRANNLMAQRTGSTHISVLYPSITDIPGEAPSREPVNVGDTDPNRDWHSGEVNRDPIEPGSPEDQQKLNVGDVQETANAINTQWWKSNDPNVWKTAVMNAFRTAILSPRKSFNHNMVHMQQLRHLPHDATAADMFRTLEFNRRRWNAARGHDPYGHLRFAKELKVLIRNVQEQFPNQYSPDDAQGIALGVIGELVSDAEQHLLEKAQQMPGRFDPQSQTWIKNKPTSNGLMSSAYDAVKAQLSLALGTRPKENEGAAQKLQTLDLSPHIDLEGMIKQAALEYHPDKREDFENLNPEMIGDPNKFAGKYGAFVYSHLDAIEAVGKNIDSLARIAHEDMMEGGSGHLFRNAVLKLNVPGVNPKVASFAWLLLAPTSSELGTMDTHMARALQGSHATGTFLPQMKVDEISQPLHYYGAERALKAMRDSMGYQNVPLGQFQWAIWDKLRGAASDHRPAAVLDTHMMPHAEMDWPTTTSARFTPEWDPDEYMTEAMAARRRAWTQYMQEHGGAALDAHPDPANPTPYPGFDPDNPMRPGANQAVAHKHHHRKKNTDWFNAGDEDHEHHLHSVHPHHHYHIWGFWGPQWYPVGDGDNDADDGSSAVGDGGASGGDAGGATSYVLSLSQEGGMKFAAAWVKRGRNLNSLETYLKEQDDAMVGQPGWKHFKVAALNTMAALDWESSCPNCGEILINGICPACHWTQIDNPDMARGIRPDRRDFRDRKDWFDTGYTRGHPHSSAQNPVFRFVFYRGQLEVDKPETSFRHLLDRLLKEHNKNIGDYDVEDKDVASGDIYQHENGIDIELQSLADNDTQNQALDRVEQWAKGMNLIGDIRPTSKADTAGSMISLEPDNKEDLAHPNGEPVQRLHLTLAHFPSEEGEPDKEALKTLTQQFASVLRPIKGVVKGMNKFEGDEDTPHVAEVDAPGLKEFQAALFKKLKQDGHKPSEKYDFKPHITIAYTPKGEELDKDLTGVPVSFGTIAYHHGGEKYEFPLGDSKTAAADPAEVLLEASKKIKDCGDYGQLFWNPQTKKAIWVAGDADGDGKETTKLSDIEKILKVPGVKDVEVADEWMPNEEDGYVQLNKDKMQDADGGWISEDWAAV
jgi:2'-5' RNA ligase